MKRKINIPRTSIFATHTLSSLMFIVGSVFFILDQHWEWYFAIPGFFLAVVVLWIPVVGGVLVSIVCHFYYQNDFINLSLLSQLPLITIVCIVFLYRVRIPYD